MDRVANEAVRARRVTPVDQVIVDVERLVLDDRTDERDPRVLIPAAALMKIRDGDERQYED
jgi:hypothetical protein